MQTNQSRCASFTRRATQFEDFRERAAIFDHTVWGALSPPHTSRAPGIAIQDNLKTKFKFEVPSSDDLKLLIELLENTSWTEFEIENLLLRAIGYCLYVNPEATDVSLRVKVTRIEGNVLSLRRLHGRIFLLFNDC